MATKTNGLEFKKFYNDPEYWPKGMFHESGEITINDVIVPEDVELDMIDIKDTDIVKITEGIVFNDTDYDSRDAQSFEGYFKKWKKKQKYVYVVVEVLKEKLEEFKNTLAGTHGRIVS